MSTRSSFRTALRALDPYLGQIAHRAPRLLLVVAASKAVAPWLPEPWSSLVGWPMTTLVVVSFAALARHRFVPCLLCAAMTPLDGGAAAERRRDLLRWFHRPWPLVVLVLGAVAVPGLSLHWGLPPVFAVLYVSVLCAGAAGAVRVFALHTVLQAWCPYCRGWEGQGPREPSPHTVSDS